MSRQDGYTLKTPADHNLRAKDIAFFVEMLRGETGQTAFTVSDIAEHPSCPIREWYQQDHCIRALNRAVKFGWLHSYKTSDGRTYYEVPVGPRVRRLLVEIELPELVEKTFSADELAEELQDIIKARFSNVKVSPQ